MWLTNTMREANFTVSMMHGDMPQKERDEIMAEFRSGASRVLITTDVWGRGLDCSRCRSSRTTTCPTRARAVHSPVRAMLVVVVVVVVVAVAGMGGGVRLCLWVVTRARARDGGGAASGALGVSGARASRSTS